MAVLVSSKYQYKLPCFFPVRAFSVKSRLALVAKVHLQEIANLIMMGFLGGSIPAFVSGEHTGEVSQLFSFLAHSTDPQELNIIKRRPTCDSKDSSG